LMPDLTEGDIADTDFGTYPASQFFDDMARVTDYRADADLVEVLVNESYAALRFLQEHGVRFAAAYGRQAFKRDGRFRFWGGLSVEVVGGGPGLVNPSTTPPSLPEYRSSTTPARRRSCTTKTVFTERRFVSAEES